MQKSREVPVRLLVFVYLASSFDVGGEFAIGVVHIAGAREIIVIVIVSRHCCTVLSIQRVLDEFVVYLSEI